VHGYDVNPQYLAACETRYRPLLGSRLSLVEASIDRTVVIEPVELLVANLLTEYVGIKEFAAFVAVNSSRIEVLSSVIQCNDTADFVSTTAYPSSFDGLSSIASDIDPDALEAAMGNAGLFGLGRFTYPLPPARRHDRRRESLRSPSGASAAHDPGVTSSPDQ